MVQYARESWLIHIGGESIAYQMNITLTDEEYKALTAEVGSDEELLKERLHELLAQHLRTLHSLKGSLDARDEMGQYLYEAGLIDHIPTHRPYTPEEEAERKRLADLFGQGKPVSEMVIEGRGPRE